MFAKIHCIDYTSDQLTTELCSFKGIRYDWPHRSVILSTEHDRHDYIFPMDMDAYERLTSELEAAIRSNAYIINFTGGNVFRCRKGELRRVDPQNNMHVEFT